MGPLHASRIRSGIFHQSLRRTKERHPPARIATYIAKSDERREHHPGWLTKPVSAKNTKVLREKKENEFLAV